MLQSISHTMARLGGCGPQKCSSQDLVNFKSILPAILTFLKQAGSRRVQQQRLLSIAVELLYQDLGQQNIPASLVTVIRHIHRLPAVMDRNFPQYAMNGLLGLLVN
ncbi:MAG TPA: hypothetical protein VJQ25_08630, partial [Nitrospira sp.]|nr:hypothetical protein [Nitrospira sp.]